MENVKSIEVLDTTQRPNFMGLRKKKYRDAQLRYFSSIVGLGNCFEKPAARKMATFDRKLDKRHNDRAATLTRDEKQNIREYRYFYFY